MRAAAVARSNHYSPAESGKPALWQRLLERSTAVFASFAVIFALSGIAVAADTSIPGDPLYGLDIAMEKIGIGAGSMDERLLEAEKLAEQGDTAAALALVNEQVTKESSGLSGAEANALTAALDDLTEAANADHVEELLEFIQANAGPGVGLDGSEFGQAVSNIARGINGEDIPADNPSGNSETSNAGGNNPDDPPGNSENSNAGGNNPDDPPGNSENSNAGGNGKGQGKP